MRYLPGTVFITVCYLDICINRTVFSKCPTLMRNFMKTFFTEELKQLDR